MNLELDLMDRLVLLHVLPKEDSVLTMKVVIDLKNKLGITSAEHEEFELKQENGKFGWNEKASLPKVFDVSGAEKSVLSDAFKKLDKDKKITEEMVQTFDKIMREV